MFLAGRLIVLLWLGSLLGAGGCQERARSAKAPEHAVSPVGTEVRPTQTPTTETSTATPAASDNVAQGYRILLRRLVLPIQPSDLLNGAWAGATVEARREGVTSIPTLPTLGTDADQDLAMFQPAFAALLASGNGSLDPGKVQRSALTSMAEAVNDCHTAYLTEGQWRSIDDDLGGSETVDSLPFTFQLQPPYLIESVVAGSNADRQGVRAGDRIVTFDGTSPGQLPLSQRKFLASGAEGSSAQLVLESPDGNQRMLTVQRESVDRPVVDSRVIGNVGYIRLRTFTLNLAGVLDSTFTSLQSQGAQGFVMDLRGNLGGGEDSDVQLMSKFIPSGLLTTSVGRNGRSDEIQASGNVLPGPPPLAVLVDGGSLSASELFAGAIQQFHAGEIVGTPTPGCLQGSNFSSLDDGSSMQVTTVTVTVGPQEIVINNVGVQPDFIVPIQAADFAGNRDPQLDRAVADVNAQLGSR